MKVDPSKRPWLVAYLTLNYPDERTFLKALEYLKDKAELVEIGIPPKFAKYDGPTIRRSYKAVSSKGLGLHNFEGELRKACRAFPEERIIVMTYYDDVKENYEEFLDKACGGGVLFADAVIDFADRLEEIASKAKERGKSAVFFVSPTTPDHVIRKAAELSDPVVYLGVRPATGIPLPVGIPNLLRRVKSLTNKYVVVGFGLKEEEVPQAVGAGADGVVVGSALVKALGEGFDNFKKVVDRYLALLSLPKR
ncbi:tryptophan synthase, alpha chain [Ignicoccus hospitalis KIN4/I]|uniref:tryptophan synthase n=1 Tax=Ignicoccus hospitalis (strain KIN4/I / DSM 18386 / JCM 14125) TaxID=453591 RepID=A8A9L2_IGNH4|nr:tryptophan synthase, alpha chain [Ignicoccus hospitalis KIN4/I]HIH90189.1 tryptophan synthase subunit alpha [Desulfurococcaceae archaeon]